MNPLSFLDNFIKERSSMPSAYGAADMMSGKRNARTFLETLPEDNPNVNYSFRNEMSPGTYTPLIRNENYGHGPAMSPYPFIGAMPQAVDPNVTPMPYFRNDPGFQPRQYGAI